MRLHEPIFVNGTEREKEREREEGTLKRNNKDEEIHSFQFHAWNVTVYITYSLN